MNVSQMAYDELVARLAAAKAENARLRERIATLYDGIAHGDEQHRAWLKDAIAAHFMADTAEAKGDGK